MRNLIFIILALGLSVTACSKKKSTTTVAPPPVVDDGGGYVPGDVEDAYYSGYVNFYNNKKDVYKNLLYNIHNPNTYTYNYSVNCDIDFLRWILDDENLIDCNSSNGSFDQLANAPALVELLFIKGYTRNGRTIYPVEGLLVANPSRNFPPGYAREIPFEGELVKLSDGRYLIEAGAIALLTKSSTDIDTFVLYHVWYQGSTRYSASFGEVSIQ